MILVRSPVDCSTDPTQPPRVPARIAGRLWGCHKTPFAMSFTRSLPALVLLFCVPVALGQVAAPGDSTAYCDSVCSIPALEWDSSEAAASVCSCGTVGGVGSASSGEAITAQEIIRRVREEHERQIANVSDYTVVMTTSTVPMPVVLYYEKDWIEATDFSEAHIGFRQVSEAELAERESGVEGAEVGKEMAGALGNMLDGLGGVKGATDAASAAAMQAAMNKIANKMKAIGADVAQTSQKLKGDQSLADDLFWNEELASILEHTGKVNFHTNSENISCDILSADASDPRLAEFDLQGYKIRSISVWVADETSTRANETIRIRAAVVRPNSDEPVILRRTFEDFTTVNGMQIPRRTTFEMNGISALVQAAVASDSWTEIQRILKVLVNTGPPTAEQRAAMMRSAMELLGEEY